MILRRLLLAGLAASRAGAQSGPDNSEHYCITYFGSVQGTVTLPQGPVPLRNWNGTATCPLYWSFPALEGAIFTLCPHGSTDGYWSKPSDGVAVDVTLSFRGDLTETLLHSIDRLFLTNLLITNGSVAGPFTAGGRPAVLAKDAGRSTAALPAWIINGTQEAEIYAARSEGVYFDCNNLTPAERYQYCGDFYDINKGGCWSSYQFQWNMTNPLNFTFEIFGNSAIIDISSANDYNGTGQNIVATIHFEGTTLLPAAGNTVFWNNSGVTFVQYQENANAFELVPDQEGLPLFLNNTKTGEWYDSSNQTYSVRSGSDLGVRIPSGLQVLILAVVCVGASYVGW
jgi:hypothetical protein